MSSSGDGQSKEDGFKGAVGKGDPKSAALEYWSTFLHGDIARYLTTVNKILDEHNIGLKVEHVTKMPDYGYWDGDISAVQRMHAIMSERAQKDLPKAQFEGGLNEYLLKSMPELAREVGGIVGFQRQEDNDGNPRTSVIEIKYFGENAHLIELNLAANTLIAVTQMKGIEIEKLQYMNQLIIWHTHPVVSLLSDYDVNSMLKTYQFIEKNIPEDTALEEIYWGTYFPIVDKIQWYRVEKTAGVAKR